MDNLIEENEFYENEAYALECLNDDEAFTLEYLNEDEAEMNYLASNYYEDLNQNI